MKFFLLGEKKIQNFFSWMKVSVQFDKIIDLWEGVTMVGVMMMYVIAGGGKV